MYYKETFPNKVRLLIEEVPHLKSVSFGIWIKTGSRFESKSINGISHFLEHMFFKGTKKRSARQIAETIDSIGGQINAFTSREFTCYYVKVASEHFGIALDVLGDIFFNSTFPKEEIEKERQVILEEIKMYEDTPDDLVHDLFIQNTYKSHPLGRPIIGRAEVIKRLGREDITNYLHEHYIPGEVIISIVGDIKQVEVASQIEDLFLSLKENGREKDEVPPQVNPNITIYPRDLEQVHLCLGTKGLSSSDEDRYAFSCLNLALGGSMSSRLYQEIREKRGLSYAVYSYLNSFELGGLLTIYAGMSKENFKDVVGLILTEFSKLNEKGLSEKELRRVKDQLKGNLILKLEGTESRMSHLAKMEIYLGRLMKLEEILEKIEEVGREDIQRVIENTITNKHLSLVAIGPLKKEVRKEIELRIKG